MPSLAIFFFKQKTAYDIGLGIPAEPLFRSLPRFAWSTPQRQKLKFLPLRRYNLTLNLLSRRRDRKSGSAGMPRPISYAVFCLKRIKPLDSTDMRGLASLSWRRRAAG